MKNFAWMLLRFACSGMLRASPSATRNVQTISSCNYSRSIIRRMQYRCKISVFYTCALSIFSVSKLSLSFIHSSIHSLTHSQSLTRSLIHSSTLSVFLSFSRSLLCFLFWKRYRYPSLCLNCRSRDSRPRRARLRGLPPAMFLPTQQQQDRFTSLISRHPSSLQIYS